MRLSAMIYKESLHVLRDSRMLIIVLLLPIVMLLLFGFAISTEVNNIDVIVSYQSYNEDIRQCITRLESNPYITLKGRVDATDVYAELRRARADAAVVWNRDGEMQVIADASNPNIAQSCVAYITAIGSGAAPSRPAVSAGSVSAGSGAAPSRPAVSAGSVSAGSGGAAPSQITTRSLFNPQLRSAFNFVPGIMGMLFLLICALMTAVSIVREKETGTLELLLVSPVKPIQIIVSKMVPFLIISCIDLAIIILLSRYVLEVPMTAGALPVVLISLLYIVLALALGLFVSTISKTQVTAMLVCGMVMIMPVVMLSGLLFPIDNLPVGLKELSAIVPARWYIDAMRRLMVQGLGFMDVIEDVVILAGMTLLIVAVAVRKFNNRL